MANPSDCPDDFMCCDQPMEGWLYGDVCGIHCHRCGSRPYGDVICSECSGDVIIYDEDSNEWQCRKCKHNMDRYFMPSWVPQGSQYRGEFSGVPLEVFEGFARILFVVIGVAIVAAVVGGLSEFAKWFFELG